MPNFRNTSSRELGILHQGRKISIPPGAIVDGPEHFKMYKSLSIVSDDEVQRYHKILPKVVRHDPSSALKRFIKPGESLMNSTTIDSLPLNPHGIDSIHETKRYLGTYPKAGLKVSIYLEGSKDKVKNFILSTAGKIKFSNVEFIWLNDEQDVEIKTSTTKQMLDSSEIFKMRHSAELLIIDDYISTFIKVGCISKIKLPSVFNATELSSHFVKNTLINNHLDKKKVDISIVTLTHNPGQYNDMLDDLLKQRLNNSYEIIAIPNYNMEYTSCAEALNIGRDLSSGEVVIMCHQDLRVPQGWLHGIVEHIKYFETKKISWGVLGMAGCNKFGAGHQMEQDLCVIYLSDKIPDGRTYAQAYRGILGQRKEVQTIDELCLIVPKNAPFRFDEQILDHFHWYGADICLDALSKGYRNFAIDAECVHLSDGRSNLSGANAQKFLDDAKKIWWKWGNRFPYFRTTTATFMFKEKVIVMGIFILINNSSGNKNLPELVRMV